MSRNLHREVTDRVLAEMKAGAAPWIKPWSAYAKGDAIPRNATTGRPYSGANVILLWTARAALGFPTGRFLTFKQALEAGGNVRKGERGHKVYFVSTIEHTDEETGKPVRIPFLKEYTVFNVSQCDNLPAKLTDPDAPPRVRNTDARNAEADDFLSETGAQINEGQGQASYSTAFDRISMPAFEGFASAAHFYCTVFHELVHWTGHKSRLDRDIKNRFGSHGYAFEELVAELGAAFLCAEFGFDGELRHASYLSSWIKLMEDHDRAFFSAASMAQKAVDHLRGLVAAEPLPMAA